MIKLFHTTNEFSSKINGIRKVVYKQNEFINNDTVLFSTVNEDIDEKINLIITTSTELYNRYNKTKEILYFT